MKKLFLAWCLIFGYSLLSAQPYDFGHPMPVGAYYYPEHWPEAQWDRDLGKMAELGFQFTHFGEFAWAMMEPEEGQFDFEWLDKAVGLADKHGLKVIMCTPTPTPPAWLTEKHPEILTVNDQGLTQHHGSRLHVSYNHPTYRYYTERIVRKLAERYGQDERIWGWQVDNEPHYGVLYDYSEGHERAFQDWLREKYGSIDSLNIAWGAVFWSQSYNHFGQVQIPNKNRAPQGANPHALLDFQRFNAEELAEALRFQADLLKSLVDKRQWVTTNYAYFKFLPSVDPFLNREDFDFAAHTMYLTSGFLSDEGGPLAHRLGSGLELAFSQEFAESVNGYTGIMELQPGQINWGVINPQPLPGAVRMWGWHAFGLGDEFVCTYRFRQPLFGGEQTHKGVMETDGVTVARGGKEYVQFIEELQQLTKSGDLKADATMPAALKARKTAFYWEQDNLWSLGNQPHHSDWDSWAHHYTYYQNLKRLGAPVTFVSPGEAVDPEEYPFWVVPAAHMIDPSQVKIWEDYARAGGHLILSVRTGTKDHNSHIWEALLQEPIWDLIGARVEYYDHLPAKYPGQVSMGGKTYPWHIWGDVLSPMEGTRVLASHDSEYYKGAPAVVSRDLGAGSVTYTGVWSDNWELEYEVLRAVYGKAGAKILNLPPYVFTEWRDGVYVAVNYSSKAVEAPVPDGAKVLLGGRQLEPGGVTVWVE
ncbi:beta-galactosidase [Phaeodactylibacter xiamenensis]|uniref:beta-galactosidase n=1 Tax=Phaeodactylibacter xiamenensis TaxID=1524460 RepID=UPI003CCBDE6E